MRWLGTVAFLYLGFVVFAVGAKAQETAARVSVRIGQSVEVPLAGVETVMAIEEHVVQVAPTPQGFVVLGRRLGDTIVQAFTASALHVYVVHVAPAPVAPPGPGPLPNINYHDAITGFWGDNRYQISYSDSTLLGGRFDHLASFHGRADDGEYKANLQFTNGALGNHLLYATVGWLNDAKTLALETGDVSGRLHGVLAGGSVPVRGLRTSLTRKFGGDHGEWTGEIFAGEMRGAADPYATRLVQPAVGASLSGHYVPYRVPDLAFSFGSSLLAFSTSRTSVVQPGQAGTLAGLVTRAVYKKDYALELRSSLSLAAARAEGGQLSGVPSLGLTAQHRNGDGQERVDYERAQPGTMVPQSGGPMPGQERMSASFQRQARGVNLTGSASYAKITDLVGQSGGGLSFSVGTSLPITRQSRFSLSAGRAQIVRPSSTLAGEHLLRGWTRTFGTGRLDYRPAGGGWALLSEAGLVKSDSGDSEGLSATGSVSLQKRRATGDRWDGAAVLSAAASQSRVTESVLAVDQPPATLTMSAAAQGRFVQGPFDSFGGLGLQVMASPSFQVAPRLNIGFRFTPTVAHQIAATYDTARWIQNGAWVHSVSATYTYHFGDAVRAVPIFEFMSYGTVEGRICYDENADGSCGPDEPPLPGIPLLLSNGARAKSAADGSYRFERVKPGFYHLDVDEEAMREKGRPTTVLAAAFDLPVRGAETKSFGVARSCRIRGHLVHDTNADGKADENEPMFGGPTVVATGAGGTFQGHVNKSGTFAMIVPCGEYGLEIDTGSLPAMRVALDEDEVRVTTTIAETPAAKLLVGSVRTIAGLVFIDRNGNGERDADEPVVPNARVRFGNVVGETDETGAYLLRRLPAGPGEVTVDGASLPAGLRPGPAVTKTLSIEPVALENVALPVVPAP